MSDASDSRRKHKTAPEMDMQEFVQWRRDVDSDRMLDTFDLALGWFSGRGYEHSDALDLARRASDRFDA